MAQDKTLKDSVYQNLVSANYLHSNKFNFINSVNATKQFKKISPESSLGKADASLKSLYNKALVLEEAFYADMGVKGALDFSQKYLLYDKDIKKSGGDTDYKIILSIINSLEFKNKLENLADYGKIQEMIISQAGGETGKSNSVADITRADIYSTISNLLGEGGLLTSFEQQQKFFKEAGVEIPKKVLTSAKSKYFKNLINANVKKSLTSLKNPIRINSKIIKEFEKEMFNKGVNPDKIPQYKELLKDKMNEAILRGEFSTSSQVVGWVLETSFYFSQLNVQITPNDLEDKKLYKLTDKDYEKTVSIKSKSDIIFTGKSGAKYPIQLKNTKNDYGNHFMINLQSKINLDTLLGTVVKSNVIDTDTAQEIGYLLTNILFLKDSGLDIKNHKQKLSTQEVSKTRNYVNSLLNGCLDYFLGSYLKKQGANIEVTKGNLFFIYQGKYLIPISLFFKSALNIIKSLKENQQGGPIKGSFGSMRIPTLENFSSDEKTNAEAMKQEKVNVMDQLTEGERDYPESLRSIGGNYGQAALRGINLKGAYFYINTATLEELLRNIK